MIITRTPFRVSLFGGGTDHPLWFNEHGGSVLGFALNKYCWITLRELPPFYDYKYRIVYSKHETTKTAAEIEHPVVKAVMSKLETNLVNGFELHHDGEIPARAGLGSSSSFTVGFIKALDAYGLLNTPIINKMDLAEAAIYIERNVLKETVGNQDQVWAACGGLNRIHFGPWEHQSEVVPLNLPEDKKEDFLDHLMMFFTGFQRTASEIEAEKFSDIRSKLAQLKFIQEHVDAAEYILRHENRPMDNIGRLLHGTWRIKKELARNIVSNTTLDNIYDTAKRAGAIGGKLLGAGGGGFFLFVAPPEYQENIRSSLRGLIEIPVGIDWEGSKVIYPNGASY